MVRWLARIYTKDENGVETKEYLPLHDCDEEDFDQFHPIQEKHSETL